VTRAPAPSAASGEPRVLLPSMRKFRRRAFQGGLYEAQDVLAGMVDADLLCLEPQSAWFHQRERWQRRLLYRDVTRLLASQNPGLGRVRVTGEYDLFVAVCQNYWDLLALNAIDGWKDRCRTSVCWLDEIWVADLPSSRYWLHLLNRFDHVFIGYEASVEPVSRALGRRCHWIGGAVDTLRFTPYPRPSERVIDVYRIGRTSDGVHDALKDAVAEKGWFYVHDTVRGSDLEPLDHREHRSMVAQMAQRSRYFMVAPAKVDMAGETRGQVEMGYRYYEGSAAGVVMVGQPADSPGFRERFDWPDAVVELETDGSDVVEVLTSLNGQPARLEAISRRNAAQSLLRHDWLYRWQQIFDAAGVARPPRMALREQRLLELARMAMSADRARLPLSRLA
jgi:hypothetical protein